MRLPSRRFCAGLLLILLIGQVSLTLHVASHTNADHTVCQLCSGYNDSSHAVPTIGFAVQSGGAVADIPHYYTPVVTTVVRLSYQQRAPPAFA